MKHNVMSYQEGVFGRITALGQTVAASLRFGCVSWRGTLVLGVFIKDSREGWCGVGLESVEPLQFGTLHHLSRRFGVFVFFKVQTACRKTAPVITAHTTY